MIRSLIAAYAIENGAIGAAGDLPWHLPDDLARFRKLTMGHTLIHGRRTHESLGGRQLDGRKIIILSRSLRSVPDNAAAVAPSIDRAFQLAREKYRDSEAFVAGGGQVYRETLDRGLVDRMYLTLVEASVEGDTFFPPYEPADWEVVHSQYHPADDRHEFAFTFQTLEHRGAGANLA